MPIHCLLNNAAYLFGKCAPLEKENALKKVTSESIMLSETADVDNSTKQTTSSCDHTMQEVYIVGHRH